MNKQDNILTPIEKRWTEALKNNNDLADLLEIAKDVINTRGSFNIEGVKQWLPAYSNYAELKENLHPLILDYVIDHAIKNAKN